MSDQKRASLPPSYTPNDPSPTAEAADTPNAGDGDEVNSQPLPNPSPGSTAGQHAPDSEGEDGRTSSQSSDGRDEYILVKLEDLEKEIQCPLCLGIIRKTRTVMECMHRFCRECIDKAMRIGNNECPACRTHCASRRSLRDDPNFDALIAALCPDVDFDSLIEALYIDDLYECKKEIQAPIAETFRRQSEELGRRKSTPKATATTFMKRSQQRVYRSRKNSYHHRRGRAASHTVSPILSDYDEEEDFDGNDAIKVFSSSEEPSPDRMHKRGRMVVSRSSQTGLDFGFDHYDIEKNRENFHTSPLRAGNKELSWGKGGVRSQTRHSNSNGSNGRSVRTARLNRLIEYLHNLDENENKLDVHLKLLPLNEQSMPLESSYLCCPPTSYIRHIRQFVAIRTSGQAEEIDLFVKKPQSFISQPSNQVEKVQSDDSEEMQILGAEESLTGLLTSFASSQGDLELLYRTNVTKDMQATTNCSQLDLS